MSSGIVNIRGKDYKTVALRVSEFRAKYPIDEEWGIHTEIVSVDESAVVMRAWITSGAGEVVAVGHAEEARSSRGINSTSALENCETSAVGRALAAAGFGGDEYASADEVAGAIAQQSALRPKRKPQQVDADTLGAAIYGELWPEAREDFYAWAGGKTDRVAGALLAIEQGKKDPATAWKKIQEAAP